MREQPEQSELKPITGKDAIIEIVCQALARSAVAEYRRTVGIDSQTTDKRPSQLEENPVRSERRAG